MKNIEKIAYTSAEDGIQITVQLEGNTVWLTQEQISKLFDRERSVISKHIKNIFITGELTPDSTCAYFAQVQIEGARQVVRNVQHFNLDMILSVGYRVNSKKGTQFRQWANNVLNQYLVKGYALNQEKLEKNLAVAAKYLEQLIQPIHEQMPENELNGFLELLKRFTKTMVLLNRFDSGELVEKSTTNPQYQLLTAECLSLVAILKEELTMKGEASQLFGNQKDSSFDGIIGAINQTAFGEEVYPTIEAKASHLLYFIIKSHPFSDGNKRIASFLFVWYLQKNNFHLNKNNEYKINENGLTAIALFVAQSNPNNKEIVINLIENLIY